MTTLSRPDPIPEPENLVALPSLPRDEGGPVFAEPWEAQAFALAVKLSEQGHFTWKEWAAALADELKAAANRGEPDDGSRYYQHWLAALERLVAAKGLSDPATGTRPTASPSSWPPPRRCLHRASSPKVPANAAREVATRICECHNSTLQTRAD